MVRTADFVVRVNPLTRPVLEHIDADRSRFELRERGRDQRARLRFATGGDCGAAEQGDRGRELFGRGDDRTG